MAKLLPLIFTIPFIVSIACGSADPATLIIAGQRALGSGDSESALSKFKKAAAQLEPGDPQFVEAKLGVIEALISTEPSAATKEFLSAASAFPRQIGENQFVDICGKMISSRQYLDAIDLIYAGTQRFGPESNKLRGLIDRIKKEAASSDSVVELIGACPGYLE